MSDASPKPPRAGGVDLRERGGVRNGAPQFSERRLFVQLLVFGECDDATAAARAIDDAGVEAVVYADLHDPRGVGVLALAEDPERFVSGFRPLLAKPPFATSRLKPEYAMLGRTYGSGFEPDLADWLLHRPRRVLLGPGARWAVWYPLRRTGAFAGLPTEEQSAILREHGRIGHGFGETGHVQDIRLACFGLDRDDNDFVIGLAGTELHALSLCVQAMRGTRQTSQFVEQMGPFFVGRTLWQSALRAEPA